MSYVRSTIQFQDRGQSYFFSLPASAALKKQGFRAASFEPKFDRSLSAMTDHWQETERLAVIGSERGELSAAARKNFEALGAKPTGSAELDLLTALAMARLLRKAGAVLPQKKRPMLRSPLDSRPVCSLPAARALSSMLAGAHREALPEWLSLAVLYQKALPPEVLPDVLALFFEKKLDRERLGGALGERGEWLASQHPEWRELLSSKTITIEDWPLAPLNERLLFLQKMRADEPEKALEAVRSTWNEEPPDARARFLEAFKIGLGPADEPFLESALADGRMEVRRAASALLAGLDGSRFGEQLADFGRTAFSKNSGSIELDLSLDLEKKLPSSLFGAIGSARAKQAPATILAEVLNIFSIKTWEKSFETPPSKALSSLLQGASAEAVLPFVAQAAARASDENWSRAIAEVWATATDRAVWQSEAFADFLQSLPDDLFEETASKALEQPFFLLETGSLLKAMMNGERFWPPKLTMALFGHLRFWSERLDELSWNGWHLEELLKKAAYRAAPEAADGVRGLWQPLPRLSPIGQPALNRFFEALDFRTRFRKALSEP